MDVMSKLAIAGASIFSVGAGATVDAGVFDTRYTLGDFGLLIVGGPETAAGAIDVIVSYGKSGDFTTKLKDVVRHYARGASGVMAEASLTPDATSGAIRIADTARAAGGFTSVVDLGNLFIPTDVTQVRVSIVNNGTTAKTFCTAFISTASRRFPNYATDFSA